MRANAEVRREWVRRISRWRNARAARAYSGRRVAAVAVFCGGDVSGDEDVFVAEMLRGSGFGVVATLKGVIGDGAIVYCLS
jgi:hypothetical protein